jgi:hypothetical protein
MPYSMVDSQPVYEMKNQHTGQFYPQTGVSFLQKGPHQADVNSFCMPKMESPQGRYKNNLQEEFCL